MMRNIFCFALAFLLLNVTGFSQSYGLTFSSHEVVLEKRTALDLSPEDSICFSKNFDLNFDIKFLPNHETYFGYVLRMITHDNQNIDLIYNQRSSDFRVIIGESLSGISFSIDSLHLYKEWSNIDIKFDLSAHTVELLVNQKSVGKSNVPFAASCYKFLWGANDFQKFKTRDIPPMQIKDIKLSEQGSLKHYWPLDEIDGDVCNDKNGNRQAKVTNPVWIKPKHQKWEMAASFTINGFANVGYDPVQDRLFIGGNDSVGVYQLKGDRGIMQWTPNAKHQNLLVGNQAVYDSATKKFYDVYVDKQQVFGYDFDQRQWSGTFAPGPLTEFWHANKFISPIDGSLYVVGGYGQLRYKNEVLHYNFATQQWDSIKAKGDYFPPRYLSALGVDKNANMAYIIGGYGSQTGDQMLDPKNYYDLYRFDIKTSTFKKVYNFKPFGSQFAFANSLVVGPGKNDFYGLIFPNNDRFNSALQLVKGSLTDSTLHLVADSIPYSFHDIESYADLYYSPISNKLIAVTMLYSKEEAKDKNTIVKIFTLNFPPQAADSNTFVTAIKKQNRYWLIIPALIAAGLIIYLLRKKKTQPEKKEMASTPAQPEKEEVFQPIFTNAFSPNNNEKQFKSSIFLFGHFQVYDKEGNDITRLFTPLLKELFLIILIYTVKDGRGISSEGLDEILWHDKSAKDAKNNRSVNIAKLKVILEKIGTCVINKEAGYWQFQTPDDSIYIDYKRFTQLKYAAEHGQEYIHPLADVVRRGPFLSQTEYNWLDNVKSAVSNSVIDLCVNYIKNQNITNNAEFIIELTHYVFYFDQLNEDALMYKCKSLIQLKRHTLANNTYLKFVKDYKDIYGEEFDKTFHDVIN
jgi:two-component SAPR family response regulator